MLHYSPVVVSWVSFSKGDILFPSSIVTVLIKYCNIRFASATRELLNLRRPRGLFSSYFISTSFTFCLTVKVNKKSNLSKIKIIYLTYYLFKTITTWEHI